MLCYGCGRFRHTQTQVIHGLDKSARGTFPRQVTYIRRVCRECVAIERMI